MNRQDIFKTITSYLVLITFTAQELLLPGIAAQVTTAMLAAGSVYSSSAYADAIDEAAARGKSFGHELLDAISDPSLNAGQTEITINNTTETLNPGTFHPGAAGGDLTPMQEAYESDASLEELTQDMLDYYDNAGQNEAAAKAWDTATGAAFGRSHPDISNDPVFTLSDSILSQLDQTFIENIQNCITTETVTQNVTYNHIPDYYTCNRTPISGYNGTCTITQTVTAPTYTFGIQLKVNDRDNSDSNNTNNTWTVNFYTGVVTMVEGGSSPVSYGWDSLVTTTPAICADGVDPVVPDPGFFHANRFPWTPVIQQAPTCANGMVGIFYTRRTTGTGDANVTFYKTVSGTKKTITSALWDGIAGCQDKIDAINNGVCGGTFTCNGPDANGCTNFGAITVCDTDYVNVFELTDPPFTCVNTPTQQTTITSPGLNIQIGQVLRSDCLGACKRLSTLMLTHNFYTATSTILLTSYLSSTSTKQLTFHSVTGTPLPPTVCAGPGAITPPITITGNLAKYTVTVTSAPTCANGMVGTYWLTRQDAAIAQNNNAWTENYTISTPITEYSVNWQLPNGCDASYSNLSRMCSTIDVTADCNSLFQGDLSCYTDMNGVEHCPTNDASNANPCAVYENDPSCVFVTSEPVEGAVDVNGDPYLFQETWDCGETIEISTLQTDPTSTCGGWIRCMGTECTDLPDEANTSFADAAAMLKGAEAMSMDMNCTGPDCEIFKGDRYTCKKAVFGYVDCCEKATSVSLSDYLLLMFEVGRLDAAIHGAETLTLLGMDIKGAWDVLREPAAVAYDALITPFSSAAETITGASEVGLSTFTAAIAQEVGAFVYAQFGSSAAAALFTTTLAEDGITQLFTFGGEGAWLATTLQVIYYAYLVYQIVTLLISIIYACEEDEFELGVKRALKSCHYTGTYCEDDIFGACFEEKESYCCFSNPFARILQEQTHPLLGRPWGTAKNPDCGGITPLQMASVDFSQVNLEEWVGLLYQNDVIPDLAQAINDMTMENLTGGGSALQTPDLPRDNTIERTEMRLENIDPEEVRRQIECELWGQC